MNFVHYTAPWTPFYCSYQRNSMHDECSCLAYPPLSHSTKEGNKCLEELTYKRFCLLVVVPRSWFFPPQTRSCHSCQGCCCEDEFTTALCASYCHGSGKDSNKAEFESLYWRAAERHRDSNSYGGYQRVLAGSALPGPGLARAGQAHERTHACKARRLAIFTCGMAKNNLAERDCGFEA